MPNIDLTKTRTEKEIREDDFITYAAEVVEGMVQLLERRIEEGDAYLKENPNDEAAIALFDHLTKQFRRLRLAHGVLTGEF